jgi:methionine--tRNA ligase beta chain
MITIDDFKKIEIRIGKIISAEKIPDTDKLLRCMVDVGEGSPRQIVSGIAQFVSDPETLVGKKFPYVTNLEPRTIKGYESNGMILAAHSEESFSFLPVDDAIPPGTRIG